MVPPPELLTVAPLLVMVALPAPEDTEEFGQAAGSAAGRSAVIHKEAAAGARGAEELCRTASRAADCAGVIGEPATACGRCIEECRGPTVSTIGRGGHCS